MTTSTLSSRIQSVLPVFCMIAVMGLLVFAPESFAAGAASSSTGKVTGFLATVSSLLSGASIVVITIAIIFAGYQIAFAHKRISDVAPILVGALLIGGAAEIASMLMK